ncbi:hypothetical protein OVA24_09250 [Luteolibacter sp. SL250]|uniref:hypothetical protein n=1 Tax=Luteolibacter sp. SL250 TaxID=2995170 RepID=UPI00226DA449|nr:hypothetical protein [Luteolibacter sp. SL250]WAC21569.1 hypothetical protein OVA24_09250 [Luteolibacter sp. SL250]
MSDLQHPSGLNPVQQYRQASHFLRKTSRAKNPAWYQHPLELDFQLHIRSDGAGVTAYLHDHRENLWAPGPPLEEQHLLDTAAITAYATAALDHVRSAGGTSLGVILHVADEFSLTEIKPELHDRETLGQLRQQAIDEPASILADFIQEDLSSWRLLPYFSPASHSIATAVTVSRRHAPALDALRALGEAENFPVITCALSSPLIALLGIPGNVRRTPERPAVAILQYTSFTVIAFLDGNSDLMLLRTQLHRGLRRPPNFRQAIATALASLEIDSPDIFVFALGADVDRTLLADLSPVFPTSHIEEVSVPGAGVIPTWCAEYLISIKALEPVDDLPGTTFQAFQEDRWALQDFLPATREMAEIFPTKQEISLLRILRYTRAVAAIIALATIGWVVFGLFKIINTPEWAFEPSETTAMKKRVAALNIEKSRIDHWNTLLEDRSKGWTVMECLVRLFPENSGILIRSFDYSARPDATPGQPRVGMTREWKINGMTNEQGVQLLNSLNSREGISARFNEIAAVTGNPTFRTDIGTRSLIVSVRTSENAAFRRGTAPGGPMAGPAANAAYPFTFSMDVTQRFEATDPSAILTAKAP